MSTTNKSTLTKKLVTSIVEKTPISVRTKAPARKKNKKFSFKLRTSLGVSSGNVENSTSLVGKSSSVSSGILTLDAPPKSLKKSTTSPPKAKRKSQSFGVKGGLKKSGEGSEVLNMIPKSEELTLV